MMPIDTAVWARDLAHNIADLPVQVRLNRRIIVSGALNVSSFDSGLLDGGLPVGVTAQLIVLRSDVARVMPRDLIEIRQRDGKWFKVEVIDVPDEIDPNAVSTTMTIASPDKP